MLILILLPHPYKYLSWILLDTERVRKVKVNIKIKSLESYDKNSNVFNVKIESVSSFRSKTCCLVLFKLTWSTHNAIYSWCNVELYT